MRLLLDQGLARSAALILRQRGHDAAHTGDSGLAEADDETILDLAQAESRIVVTLDADFHAILAREARFAPSVIRIRIEGLDATAQADVVLEVLAAAGADLDRGAVATVTRQSIRVRRLPLRGS